MKFQFQTKHVRKFLTVFLSLSTTAIYLAYLIDFQKSALLQNYSINDTLNITMDYLFICKFSNILPEFLQQANYLTPVSYFLIIWASFLTKRKSHLVKVKNRYLQLILNNISLPKIEDPFRKKHRLLYSFVFSIISYQLITVSFYRLSQNDQIWNISLLDILSDIAKQFGNFFLYIGSSL